MKVRVLGAHGSEGLGCRPSSFLVDGRVLVDAGSVGGALGLEEQLAIEHALVSHSHLDHVAGLGFLSETLALVGATRPLVVTSIAPVLDALRSSFFNSVVWTDFSSIPSPEAPAVRYRELPQNVESEVGHLRVTPVAVNHTVPTAGYVVHDGRSGFVYSGDTGPTEALWEAARRVPQVKAVILECSFPNRCVAIAEVAKHLTPELVAREVEKLPPGVDVWIFHIKPIFREETAAELARVSGRRIVLLREDEVYEI
jgi:ribonuclease BN (tRNA processing enzyme)